MEEFSETYIGQDYPLDKDSLNRLSLNDKFLYDNIYIESPRGVVLWKKKTSNISLVSSTGTNPTSMSGLSFDWTPEPNRVYQAHFTFRSILTDGSGSGDQRLVVAIYLNNSSQNGYITWWLASSLRHGGHHVQAIIPNPASVESIIDIKYEMVNNSGPNITLEAGATYPAQFWIEDIGSYSMLDMEIT